MKASMIATIVASPLFFPACAPDPYQGGQPPEVNFSTARILVLGDSISYGWMPHLQTLLPSAEIVHIPENSRNSHYAALHVDEWLAQHSEPFDAIIWNVGMWNTLIGSTPEPGVIPDQPPENLYTTIEKYRSDILVIAQKLKATGSRIVFLTTTYIPNAQNGILAMGHEISLNNVALGVIPQLGPVIDVHAYSQSLPSDMRMYGYDIHYTEEGYATLAAFIKPRLTGEIQ